MSLKFRSSADPKKICQKKKKKELIQLYYSDYHVKHESFSKYQF